MLLVKNYGDPLGRRGKTVCSPYREHIGKIVTVFTASSAPPFTGLLAEATPEQITLITGIDLKRRTTGPALHIPADKIAALSVRL